MIMVCLKYDKVYIGPLNIKNINENICNKTNLIIIHKSDKIKVIMKM